MTREEALQKLQNFYNWYNDDEFDFDKEKEIKYDNDLKNIIEYLRQPITLAEFLGWEENKIYIFFNLPYMVKDDELCFLNNENEWRTVNCYRTLTEIKQRAKKVEPKKYYLKLKFKYNDFLCKCDNEVYINCNSENEYFLDLKDDFENCKTQFTDEEIKHIKLPEPLTIDMFEKIEVE